MDIHTKFEPKQEVWLMLQNKPTKTEVLKVEINISLHEKEIKYLTIQNKREYSEDELFGSKEELKKSLF